MEQQREPVRDTEGTVLQAGGGKRTRAVWDTVVPDEPSATWGGGQQDLGQVMAGGCPARTWLSGSVRGKLPMV